MRMKKAASLFFSDNRTDCFRSIRQCTNRIYPEDQPGFKISSGIHTESDATEKNQSGYCHLGI